MTKKQLELATHFLQRSAEKHGVSLKERKEDIEKRIQWVMTGGDPSLAPYLDLIPREGFLPTAEEVIYFLMIAFPIVIEREREENRRKGIPPQ